MPNGRDGRPRAVHETAHHEAGRHEEDWSNRVPTAQQAPASGRPLPVRGDGMEPPLESPSASIRIGACKPHLGMPAAADLIPTGPNRCCPVPASPTRRIILPGVLTSAGGPVAARGTVAAGRAVAADGAVAAWRAIATCAPVVRGGVVAAYGAVARPGAVSPGGAVIAWRRTGRTRADRCQADKEERAPCEPTARRMKNHHENASQNAVIVADPVKGVESCPIAASRPGAAIPRTVERSGARSQRHPGRPMPPAVSPGLPPPLERVSRAGGS